MKNNIVRNYLYNLGYQLLILVVPLVTIPYISRVLGTENIGLFNFFQSIVSYFVLFGCIGLNLYGQREVAFCKDSVFRRSRVFWELQIIRLVTVSLSLLLYYFIIVRNSTGYANYYTIFIIEIVASFFDISWFFQGVENFGMQALRNLITKFLGIFAIFSFVKTEEDLNKYIFWYALTVLVGNLSMWLKLPSYLGRTSIKMFGISKHIIPVFIVFLPQIATSIYAQLDKTMLRVFGNYIEVGYYGQAEKIVKIAVTVTTALGAVMLSRIANTFSSGDNKAVKEYIVNSFKFLFAISYPIMFGIMAISYGMVPWFFGEGYDMVAPCMILLAPIILIIGISNVLGTQYLLPTNRMKEYTVSVSIGLVVNVTCNTFLISKWGCLGAAIATVVAETVVSLVQFFFVRKEFELSLLKLGNKNFVCAFIMGLSVFALSWFLDKTFVNTIIEIAVGLVLYILLLVLFKDVLICDILSKIKAKFSK